MHGSHVLTPPWGGGAESAKVVSYASLSKCGVDVGVLFGFAEATA